MTALSHCPTGSPRTADDLLSLLPAAADADRPWLVWYSPTERIELTGHVLAMWASKVAGFLTEQAPAQPLVELAAHGSWRGLVWALGTWLAGGCVRDRSLRLRLSGAGTGREADAAADLPAAVASALAPADACVSTLPTELDGDADLEVLLPAASLATAWDGAEPLPPLVVDGVADVMAYADSFRPAAVDQGAAAIIDAAHLVRPDAGARSGAADVRLSAVALGRAALASRVDTWAEEYRAEDGQAPAARAIIVRTPAPQPAPERDVPVGCDTVVIEEVLAVWAAGACAVVLSEDADEALARTAARQEQALVPVRPASTRPHHEQKETAC